MLKLKILFAILITCSLAACGQINKHQQHKTITQMDTNKISNPIAKQAFLAWQEGNSEKWISYFTADATLLDDGSPRNFKKFSTEAIGTERFTSIDKVDDNGLSIYGKFHSDTWGDFKTYFKFYINTDGKIYQLEIGQAD